MLDPTCMSEALLHPSRRVRAAVARFLGDRGPPDVVHLSAMIAAGEAYGVAANRAVFWHAAGARVGPAEASRILALLRSLRGREDRFVLLRLLGTAAVDGVTVWGDRLQATCPEGAALSAELGRRRALARHPTSALWEALCRLASVRAPGPPDEDRASALAAALAARRDVPAPALLRAFDDPVLGESWIVGHVADQLARQRHVSAVPRLVSALEAPPGHRLRAAIRALGRLGDARAVPAIEARCARRGPELRRASAEALARLPPEVAGPATARLLEQEPDPTTRAAFCRTLCRLFVHLDVVARERGAEAEGWAFELATPLPSRLGDELAVARLVRAALDASPENVDRVMAGRRSA